MASEFGKTSGIAKFVELLDAKGELLHIAHPVSCEIEISKITDEQSKLPGGGKALLFENVSGFDCPVATNLFGSDFRMSLALNVPNLAEAGAEIASLMKTQPPKTFLDFFKFFKQMAPLVKIAPRKFKGGVAPCQEVVHTGDDVDVTKIPVLKCWPLDAGRFVTLPLVFTKPLDGGPQNLGMYRLQIYDAKTTGMHWHIHKDGAHFFSEYRKAKKRMPVAVAIGADPAVIYAATAPLPRGVDELLLAGFFQKSGVKTVKCKTVDLEVPANAEFILEGYVDPEELRLEGPFGDHTGYYSLADMYPVFHITAITHKKKPLYCATLVGPPPMEDCYMAKATERIFLPMLQSVMPEIRDYFLPWEGVFHNAVIVSIRKEYPAHAKKLISGLWGQGQMSFAKSVIAVDEDVEPSDLNEIARLLETRFDFESDAQISLGVLDVLDHSAPLPLMGAKIGLDLTRRISGETPRYQECFTPATPETLREDIMQRLKGAADSSKRGLFCAVALKRAGRSGKEIIEELSRFERLSASCKFIAIFDEHIDVRNVSQMLWKIFNNADPARDIVRRGKNIYLDAGKKGHADGHTREWPQELTFEQ